MISNIFVYKNLHYLDFWNPDLCQYWIRYALFTSSNPDFSVEQVHWLVSRKIDSFQMQHKRAHDYQQKFKIMITMAATASNITRLLYHTQGIAYHVEHNAYGMLPHHNFSLLISIECVCMKHYSWVKCTW